MTPKNRTPTKWERTGSAGKITEPTTAAVTAKAIINPFRRHASMRKPGEKNRVYIG